MHNNILVPTDFSITSLNLVKQALIDHKDEKINIILAHGINLSTGYSDLFFFSKHHLIEKLSSEEFEETCSFLADSFSSVIYSFRKEFFSGVTQAAFENFITGNQIEKVYIPDGYEFNLTHNLSKDILPYVQKSKLNVVKVKWNNSNSLDALNLKKDFEEISTNN